MRYLAWPSKLLMEDRTIKMLFVKLLKLNLILIPTSNCKIPWDKLTETFYDQANARKILNQPGENGSFCNITNFIVVTFSKRKYWLRSIQRSLLYCLKEINSFEHPNKENVLLKAAKK